MELGVLISAMMEDVAQSLPCCQSYGGKRMLVRHTKSWYAPVCVSGTNGSCGAMVGALPWGEMAEALFVHARKDSSRLAVTLDLDEHFEVVVLRLPILYNS